MEIPITYKEKRVCFCILFFTMRAVKQVPVAQRCGEDSLSFAESNTTGRVPDKPDPTLVGVKTPNGLFQPKLF